jgi:hypothetical protein
VEPWGKYVYNFNYSCPSERMVRVAFALVPRDFLHYIIEERTCN